MSVAIRMKKCRNKGREGKNNSCKNGKLFFDEYGQVLEHAIRDDIYMYKNEITTNLCVMRLKCPVLSQIGLCKIM